MAHPADLLAEAGDPRWSFLRERWFSAGDEARWVEVKDAHGAPLAALPVEHTSKGPIRFAQIGGSYWPFRSVPLARDADPAELAAALASLDVAAWLGRIWRLGPVAGDDPALAQLLPAARAAGWRVLRRSLGTLFELDLAGLSAGGEWPSAKTLRKNRWRLRRLEEEGGAISIRNFTGADWTAADRDAMAAIEAASWLGKLEGGGDTKFRDPTRRRYWEALCDDPVLAAMLFGSVMTIGETPAAFTFGVAAGDTRYYIANNYDDRFTQFGPGRVLLYADFERASGLGIARISWGLGDAGYKSEMGARPGAELLDLLFVRGGVLAALLKPF